MTSDEDICKFLKDAVKEEVQATAEYRRWADEAGRRWFKSTVPIEGGLRDIADEQEGHAKLLAEMKELIHCPGDDPEPEVAKASEAFDGKGSKVLITLWEDDSLTVCKGGDVKDEGDCYSMDPSPANRTLFYVAEAHYSGMGFKIRTLADGE